MDAPALDAQPARLRQVDPVVGARARRIDDREVRGEMRAGFARNGCLAHRLGTRAEDARRRVLHVTGAGAQAVRRSGVAHIPEDRGRDGLINTMTVAENYILDRYHREPYSKNGLFNGPAIRDRAQHGVEDFDIRTPSIDTHAEIGRASCRERV